HPLCGEGPRPVMRGGAAVLEPHLPLVSVTAEPLVDRGARDACRLSGDGRPPAFHEDTMDKQRPSVDGETAITMRHENLRLSCGSSTTSQLGPEALPVNNLCGNYS